MGYPRSNLVQKKKVKAISVKTGGKAIYGQ